MLKVSSVAFYMETGKIRNFSSGRRRSWSQQTSIKDSIGRMSGNWESIVFHPIRLKIPLCSRGKLKILFLAVFETGLVTKPRVCIHKCPPRTFGLQCFTASLNSCAYSWRRCGYGDFVIWNPLRYPQCKLFEKIKPGIPALLRYDRYL